MTMTFSLDDQDLWFLMIRALILLIIVALHFTFGLDDLDFLIKRLGRLVLKIRTVGLDDQDL
jgi:hypothetical protein